MLLFCRKMDITFRLWLCRFFYKKKDCLQSAISEALTVFSRLPGQLELADMSQLYYKLPYLAGVFAQWYWTHDKSKLPCCSLSASLANATYHLGTVAFGSLLIAIIRFIRAILNQIEKKLLAHHNDLTRCLLCLCKCCLWCLEK